MKSTSIKIPVFIFPQIRKYSKSKFLINYLSYTIIFYYSFHHWKFLTFINQRQSLIPKLCEKSEDGCHSPNIKVSKWDAECNLNKPHFRVNWGFPVQTPNSADSLVLLYQKKKGNKANTEAKLCTGDNAPSILPWHGYLAKGTWVKEQTTSNSFRSLKRYYYQNFISLHY